MRIDGYTLHWEMPMMPDRRRIRLAAFLFFIAFTWYMGTLFNVAALAQRSVSEQLSDLREQTYTNTSNLRLLEAQVDRNSADIRALTTTVAAVSAAMNQLTGIGIAIGGLGMIIVILQGVRIVRRKDE